MFSVSDGCLVAGKSYAGVGDIDVKMKGKAWTEVGTEIQICPKETFNILFQNHQ